jgi:hypothetical protein
VANRISSLSSSGKANSWKRCAGVSTSYNRTEGNAMNAVPECAGTFDEVLNHRLTEGVSHDELVVMCVDTAMHMGIMKLDP